MTVPTRPAGYIRVGLGCGAETLAARQRAIYQAARDLGLPEPVVYIDIDRPGTGRAGGPGQDPRAGPALAKLTVAVSTGQHDVLILGGVGTIRGGQEGLMRLLADCTRHGVAVTCVTTAAPAGRGSTPRPR